MRLNEKGYYFTVLMYGLFSAISLQKSVRERLEGIQVNVLRAVLVLADGRSLERDGVPAEPVRRGDGAEERARRGGVAARSSLINPLATRWLAIVPHARTTLRVHPWNPIAAPE